jgi:hypothetical protein
MTQTISHFWKFILIICLLFFCAIRSPGEDEIQTNLSAKASTTQAETAMSNDILRAYLQLQQQIHETQLVVQRAQRENEFSTVQNAVVFSNRLQAIEQTVELQRSHELKIVRDMMIIAGIFVVVGVMALLFTAFFHWRAVTRLAEIAAALPRSMSPNPAVAALGMGEHQLLIEQTNNRLVGALERLEKRISEVEHSNVNRLTNGQTVSATNGHGNGSEAPTPLPETSEAPPRVMDSSHAEQFVLLMNKGQVLLSEDQPAEALASFDQALALDPNHAEALVKKGDALEKLRRSQEALECYDRALMVDDSMTIAYLHKGGLLNRLERFDEAMQCYEQALRTQEKKRVA